MSKTIIAFGELLWDLLPNAKTLGGASANFIFRISGLGDNGQLISCLGDDKLGELALEEIQNLGLSNRHIQINPHFPTGTVPVSLDENGIPDFNIIPNVAYDHIELTQNMLNAATNADCIYFGTLSQRSKTSRNTLWALLDYSPNVLKFFDINLRKNCYTTEVITESLKLTHILKLNNEELIQLKSMLSLQSNELKDLATELLYKYQLKLALVTLGDKGAFLVSEHNDYHYDPGYKIDIADTVGSGDSFSAGFMHSYLNGETLENSLKFGNATGAIVATTEGGTHPLNKDEVLNFIQNRHERIFM